MEDMFCPICKAALVIECTETVCYDPVVSLEVVNYRCPKCGHKEYTELMK